MRFSSKFKTKITINTRSQHASTWSVIDGIKVQPLSRPHLGKGLLQGETQFNINAGIRRVAQVIHAVDFNDIYILRVQPVAGPCAGESEPISAVLEAVVA